MDRRILLALLCAALCACATTRSPVRAKGAPAAAESGPPSQDDVDPAAAAAHAGG